MLIIRNPAQFGEWLKYLEDLAQLNRKLQAKEEQKLQNRPV